MKNLLLVLTLLLFTSVYSTAQSTDWILYKNINGINIYTKEANCLFKDGSRMNQRVVLFKLENTTNNKVTVEWDLHVWYNGKEVVNNITPDEQHISSEINANSIIEGNTSLNDRNLYLYKYYLDFKNGKKMTKFDLSNLKVKKISHSQ